MSSISSQIPKKSNIILTVFSLSMFVCSCIGKHQTNAHHVDVNPEITHVEVTKADTIRIDSIQSSINWIATEMRGTIRRTGQITFKNGYLLLRNDTLVGGYFVVDMTTMDVTDVPIYERIARRNLIDHLKSDDFFNVDRYPESTLEITNVGVSAIDSLRISANLTIRDISKNIVFYAHRHENSFTTRFSFNRLDWNIAYEGSWAARTLVDKDVELDISVQVIR